MTTTKYEIINFFDTYQVEEEDGVFDWVINNQCSEGVIDIPDELAGEEFRQAIVDKLKECNLLHADVTLEALVFDDAGECFEIRDAETGQPYFCVITEP